MVGSRGCKYPRLVPGIFGPTCY